MSLRPEKRRRQDDINIVPLVDVLIVLIFFFLVSMQFKSMHTLNLIPPKMDTSEKDPVTGEVEIAISRFGIFFFNGRQLPKSELVTILEATARVDKNTVILLVADKESTLENTTFIIDTCRKNGLEQVKLQTRK